MMHKIRKDEKIPHSTFRIPNSTFPPPVFLSYNCHPKLPSEIQNPKSASASALFLPKRGSGGNGRLFVGNLVIKVRLNLHYTKSVQRLFLTIALFSTFLNPQSANFAP
jgi:hypothetical protein